jgi:hypothetical protein
VIHCPSNLRTRFNKNAHTYYMTRTGACSWSIVTATQLTTSAAACVLVSMDWLSFVVTLISSQDTMSLSHISLWNFFNEDTSSTHNSIYEGPVQIRCKLRPMTYKSELFHRREPFPHLNPVEATFSKKMLQSIAVIQIAIPYTMIFTHTEP